MTWTDPKTWAFQESVESAELNTHLRDNLNVVEHLIARKAADEFVDSGTTGTTFQDDDHLVAALAANEKWLMRWVVIHSCETGGVPNIKMAFTVPSGCVFNLSTMWPNTSNVATLFSWDTTATSGGAMLSPASTDIGTTVITGRVHNGANAGNIRLQWAQQTSSTENTQVYESSSVWGMLV